MTESIDQAVVVEMNVGGYVTPTILNGDVGMVVWDFQFPGFEVLLAPHKITDNTLDQDPGLGVDVGDPPTLTDGSHEKVQGGATQKVRAILTDDLFEQNGIGDGEIVKIFPAGEFPFVGIASVTKVMTLLLTVEALNNNVVDLDDIVTVSANAANTGGSNMALNTGEKQELRTLIYGMMTVSANDASVAIAEHVAGDEATFVAAMNVRAGQLGLTNTVYNQPAGGGYSDPQDQVTLFRFGYQDPLFRDFTTTKEFSGCGETAGGDEICRFLVKFSDSGYSGLEGWKNGNIGFHLQALKDLGVPLCTSCLIARLTRGDRTFLAGIQQSGSRWNDSSSLYSYGLRNLFTPDFRGGRIVLSTPVIDLAVDSVTDLLAVTASIRDQKNVELCTWSVETGVGQVGSPNCNRETYDLVGGGDVQAIPNKIDSARLSTLLVEGDYVTASLLNDDVFVRVWRVAPKEP